MKSQRSIARHPARLLLALIGLMMGFVAPVHCQGQSVSGQGTISQATVGSWVPTGNLNEPLGVHTATLLPNGKVLVVGDYYENSAELYDPAAGTWSVTSHLITPKSGHTATLLPNGQVLVLGQAQSATDGAELYDPDTGSWRPATSPTGYWRDHTATLLKSGKVLVAGGWGNPYSSYRRAALYDPTTGTWTDTGSLIVLRGAGHRATLLQDGRVLVTGGSNDADFAFGVPNAELYDPVTGTWSHAPDLHVPRFGHSATLLSDGKVLVAGGDTLQSYCPGNPYCQGVPYPPSNTAELYDPATGQWSTIGMLSASRANHTATLLTDGQVLVVGGGGSTVDSRFAPLKSAELYGPGSGLWYSTGDLNRAQNWHTATLLPNGKVLVVGDGAELYESVDPRATIGPGFTGAWFDPSQSGHGLFVEILPNNRVFAGWFTFNPAGTEQAWFVGVGTYSGNAATISAVSLPSGGRWIPNFDPNQIVNNLWGTLTFTFTDCNHGKVDFNSTLGYGAGSMNLTRLTQPAGLTCP